MKAEKKYEYDKFLQCILSGNRRSCLEAVEELFDSENIDDIYEMVIKPSLYEVGVNMGE